jgi:glycosyltransferase involved in cell wall biosynthesis
MESKFNYKNFSIVVPIYNEEEILEESTNAIFSLCKNTGIDFEIIFSENGSTDTTKKIANELTNKYSEIKIISNPEPNYGNALKAGFELAKNDLVISFDIDYYSESFLREALMLDSKYSSMTASKRLGSSEDGRRFVRRLATNFFVILLRLLFGTKLSDTHGMKAIKKTEIEKFAPQVVSTQDIFDTELLIRIEKNGGKIKEIPAKVNEIRPSVSLIYKRIPRTIKSLIKLRIIFYKESLKTKNL